MTFPDYPKSTDVFVPPVLPSPIIPLPNFACNDDSVRTDPGSIKRNEGWAYAGPGLPYGEAPPFPWVNFVDYTNGRWSTYYKNALDYLKAGNFDNGIHVTGNSEIYNNLIVHEIISSLGGINDGNRSGIHFYDTSGSWKTSFYANNSLSSNQGYALPINYPSVSNSALVSDTSGNMSWYDLNQLKYIYTTNFESSSTSGTCSIASLPAGEYLIYSQVCGGTNGGVGGTAVLISTLFYPGSPSKNGFDILENFSPISSLGSTISSLSHSGFYINIGASFTLSLSANISGGTSGTIRGVLTVQKVVKQT